MIGSIKSPNWQDIPLIYNILPSRGLILPTTNYQNQNNPLILILAINGVILHTPNWKTLVRRVITVSVPNDKAIGVMIAFSVKLPRYGNFLHGPIELISRKGVYAFRDARHICFSYYIRAARSLVS